MGRAGRPGKTLRDRPRAVAAATPRQAAFWPPSMMR